MRARTGIPGVLPCLLLLGACAVGGWSDTEPYARGASVTLTSASSTLTGELLLADEDGVIVLANNAITRAAWGVLTDFDVDGRPAPRLRGGRVPLTQELREIQLTSRYPFDLTE